MKSIVTIECFKDIDEPTQINEMAQNEISTSGWLYRIAPLPGSILYYEMESETVEDATCLIFDSFEDLHTEMQKVITDGKFHFSQYEGHCVIHLVTDEKSWKDEDNWTGPGEWNVEINVIGLLDLNKLGV